MVKNLPAIRFNIWVKKIPWRRKWHPTPVFLPGESHGQRSLAGYSPWGHEESDMIECACTYACIKYQSLIYNGVKKQMPFLPL